MNERGSKRDIHEVADIEVEAMAELTVLTALAAAPQYAIEIKPLNGQSEDEIKWAVERCEAVGWITTGRASDYDPRTHLTASGRAELLKNKNPRFPEGALPCG